MTFLYLQRMLLLTFNSFGWPELMILLMVISIAGKTALWNGDRDLRNKR